MKQRFAVDSSVACKWLIEEPQRSDALEFYVHTNLIAPDLLLCDPANILQKKVEFKQLMEDEAQLAVRVLASANVAFFPPIT